MREGDGWFMHTRTLKPSKALASRILHNGLCAAVKSAVGDQVAMMLSSLESNPLALTMLRAAINTAAISPTDAVTVLKRRIPPSMALRLKKNKDGGLPVAPSTGMTNVGPQVADPVRSVRGGRKSVLDARQTLKSAVAKAVISLLAYAPPKIKVCTAWFASLAL